MSGAQGLPQDRRLDRGRLVPLFLTCCALAAGAVLVWDSERGGWVALLPEPAIKPVLAVGAVGFGSMALAMAFWTLGGQGRTVVAFDAEVVTLRFVAAPVVCIPRRDIREVRVTTSDSRFRRWLGMGEVVVIERDGGRPKGVAHIYEGAPDELADDLRRWAND